MNRFETTVQTKVSYNHIELTHTCHTLQRYNAMYCVLLQQEQNIKSKVNQSQLFDLLVLLFLCSLLHIPHDNQCQLLKHSQYVSTTIYVNSLNKM